VELAPGVVTVLVEALLEDDVSVGEVTFALELQNPALADSRTVGVPREVDGHALPLGPAPDLRLEGADDVEVERSGAVVVAAEGVGVGAEVLLDRVLLRDLEAVVDDVDELQVGFDVALETD